MDAKKKYNHKEIQDKWNKKWTESKIYHPDMEGAKNPYYNLMMFPYPSAEGLHVGNMYAFTGADVYGRFMRLKGHEVFEPIGLDGFGIHSENYALKIGVNPSDQAKISEKRFYEQLRMIGNSFDWDRTVETYKPDYYKWTQWLFIQLFKAGLAEKKKAEVNWCPSCKTVLADEQVLSGLCERCNSKVEQKQLEQWFFKITKYSDCLLEGLDRIDWTEKVKIAQRNWIGKSEGALITFKTENSEEIKVFTTRPDTLFGATFLVLSPEHQFVKSSIDKLDQNVKKYITEALEKGEVDLEKEKTGVFSGFYAINPATKEKIPVWIGDYVLMGYGTGAIMAVPAHDERDFEFAKKYELPIKYVLATPEGAEREAECYTHRGQIKDSGDWTGWDSAFDFHKIISWLEDKEIGTKETHYHLRDWLISRQRYWGAPIPMIHCDKCGWQPVPEADLPVILPYIKDFKPLGTGVAPLAGDSDFVNVKCPNCSGPAKRETDVCDTFLDSSWYFLRYPSTEVEDKPFDDSRTKKWLPVNMYIGGAEHSVLHLLYSRFVTKVLFDQKLLDFDEPFSKFRAHGLLIKDGGKMSKSKGNVVNPDEYINKYGADTLRSYLMFLGPYDQGGDFRDSGIEGMERFLKRVRRFVESHIASENQSKTVSANILDDSKIEKSFSKTIKGVGNDVENLRYNTALAKIMELINDLNASKSSISSDHLKKLVIMLSPFAPYLTEELWEALGGKESVHSQSWPEFSESALAEEEFKIAVQISGKLRGLILVASSDADDQARIEELAKNDEKISGYLEGLKIIKVIYVRGKILNFVVT
ncbi:MAG: leucine--tRNA ligase [Candidatus Levybacteria bacterium]|nr:leucine--tRNA ligase [Candidatus Levybacteria bacterium]